MLAGKNKNKKIKIKKKGRRRKENILTCEHQVQEYYISEQHVASIRLVINKTLYFEKSKWIRQLDNAYPIQS